MAEREMPGWVRHVPHGLSLARAGLTLITYVAAFKHDKPLFAILVLAAVLTDILDGPIARATRTASVFGANVDSAADFLFYVSLPLWAAIFDPTLVTRNLPLVLVFGALYVAANLLSHATFGALGVHNRLSRTSGTVGIVFAFTAILWGLDGLFQRALYFVLMAVLAADLAQRYGAILRKRFGGAQPR